MKPILQINTKDLELLECEGTQLFRSYTKIYNYLSNNESKEIAQLFAKPISINDSEIRFVDNSNTESFVRLSDLEGDKYEQSKKKLNNYINQIKDICEKNPDWADILNEAIQFPNESVIFVSDKDRILIACWGMKLGGEGISNSFIGMDYSEKKPKIQIPEGPEDPKDPEDVPEVPEDPKEIQKDPEEEPEGSEDPPVPVSDPPVNPFPWLKYLKYFFLLFLLLLVLFLLFRTCNGTGIIPPIDSELDEGDNPESPGYNNPENPGYKAPDSPGNINSPGLPRNIEFPLNPGSPRGVIEPIDPIDVGYGDGKNKKVIVNRLNIHVEGDKSVFKKFIEDFKKIYSSKECEIIYSDDLTNRIQIKVPKDKRENLISEIQKKLNEYELLIWEEDIFNIQEYPSDPGFSSVKKRWYLDIIKAAGAWDKTKGNDSIVIAILDNGFDLSHEELKNNIYKPYNVYNRTSNVFTNKNSKHGSHVAGTAIANSNNNIGLSGIAPNCLLMPIQVSGENDIISNTAVIDGILYAIHQGADVINISLGLAFEPEVLKLSEKAQSEMIKNSYKSSELFWDKVFDIADRNNVTIVISGGNQNALIGLDPIQRNPLGIKVSAITQNEQKARFSNYGDYSTISAPGVSIYSSIPNNKFEYMQGTSMAAPIVSGAVALLKSVDKSLTTKQIISILQNTGKPISSSKGKIGNLIQLDKMLSIKADDIIENTDNCEAIKDKINKLQKEIEELKSQCQNINN